jgi:hypothetical protein
MVESNHFHGTIPDYTVPSIAGMGRVEFSIVIEWAIEVA